MAQPTTSTAANNQLGGNEVEPEPSRGFFSRIGDAARSAGSAVSDAAGPIVSGTRNVLGSVVSGVGSGAEQVAGFVGGAAHAVGDIATGMADSAVWAWRSVTSREQRIENHRLWQEVKGDLPGAGRAIWDGITRGMRDDWNDSNYGGALGRGFTEIIAAVVPGRAIAESVRAPGRISAIRHVDDVSPRTPTGSRGREANVARGDGVTVNTPTTIRGRQYTGHALDRMQERGFTPTVVDNAIRPANQRAGRRPGTTEFYDPVNQILVVTSDSAGRVITVRGGRP